MFMHGKEILLETLKRMGGSVCQYTIDPERWLKTHCDCKYGASVFTGEKKLGEESGCPELRSLYHLISAMDDEEYYTLMKRAGGIDTARLFQDETGTPLANIKNLAEQIIEEVDA